LVETSSSVKCPVCDVEMHLVRRLPFRVGGTGGGWKLIFGELAELGEEMLPLDVYLCPKCGRVELFADEKAKEYLLRISYFKKCVKCGRQIPIASEQCSYCGAEQK
jgi:predicted RNA-binding Zn-ribbon protein involved in translation (DUF1610 family)